MSVSQTPIHHRANRGGDEVDVIAIISPAPGKEARVEELLRDMTQKVHDKEPGALRYHLHKDVNSSDFIMVETYTAQADFDKHLSLPAFKELGAAFEKEGLVGKPLNIMTVKSIAGYETRR